MLDYGVDEDEQLLIETTRRWCNDLKGSGDRTLAASRLVEVGVLDIRVDQPEGAVQAACVAREVGRSCTPVFVGDWVTARGIIVEFLDVSSSLQPLLEDHLTTALAGIDAAAPRVSIGRVLKSSSNACSAVVAPLGFDAVTHLVAGECGQWSILTEQDVVASESGSFDGRSLLLSWDPSLDETASVDGAKWSLIGLALQTADMVGAAEGAFERTKVYVSERHQFGRPIGSFQALQHRLVDVFVALEAVSAASWFACWVSADESRPLEEREAIVRGIHAYAAQECVKALNECFQFHGGIAMTEELWVHHYLRRVMSAAVTGGRPRQHFRALADYLANGNTLSA